MRVLGVIPARAGSKAIPRKNLARLGGKPLIAYTCAAALKARSLDRVIVSTDSPAFAKVVKRFGVEAPFLRPKALSSDTAPMAGVLQHALQELESAGDHFDVVVVLQPTSPFRTARHIDDTVKALLKSHADAAVTVTEIPHGMGPDSAMTLRGTRLKPLRKGAMPLRRQDKGTYVARNGPAVLAVTRKTVLKGRFYDGKTVGVLMSRLHSVDIDGPEDLKLAEALLRSRDRR